MPFQVVFLSLNFTPVIHSWYLFKWIHVILYRTTCSTSVHIHIPSTSLKSFRPAKDKTRTNDPENCLQPCCPAVFFLRSGRKNKSRTGFQTLYILKKIVPAPAFGLPHKKSHPPMAFISFIMPCGLWLFASALQGLPYASGLPAYCFYT